MQCKPADKHEGIKNVLLRTLKKNNKKTDCTVLTPGKHLTSLDRRLSKLQSNKSGLKTSLTSVCVAIYDPESPAVSGRLTHIRQSAD